MPLETRKGKSGLCRGNSVCHGGEHSMSGEGQPVQNGWHSKFRDGNELAREEIIGAKVIEL